MKTHARRVVARDSTDRDHARILRPWTVGTIGYGTLNRNEQEELQETAS